MAELVHGTAIAANGWGILIVGPSGSGKSDLALRCISGEGLGWFGRFQLVSDDQVLLAPLDTGLRLSPPASIAGKLEVRGVGIVDVEHVGEARLWLVARLVNEPVERLPGTNNSYEDINGCQVRHLDVCPFEASAPIKLALSLRQAVDRTLERPTFIRKRNNPE